MYDGDFCARMRCKCDTRSGHHRSGCREFQLRPLLRAAADEVAVAVAVGACRLVMNSMGCDAEPRFLFAIFV